MKDRIEILNTPVDRYTLREVLENIREFLNEDGSHVLMPVNPIKIVKARKDRWFEGFIKNSSIVFADGIGVVWAAKILYGLNLELIKGIDLAIELIKLAKDQKVKIYFVGSRKDVIEEAVKNTKERYPGIDIVGFHEGYFNEAQAIGIMEDIKNKEPQILLVGMGARRQELFIDNLLKKTSVRICQGIGGTFDVLAGRVKRPPQWVLKFNVEWLYRLITQIYRAPRFKSLPIFVCLVFIEKMRIYFKSAMKRRSGIEYI